MAAAYRIGIAGALLLLLPAHAFAQETAAPLAPTTPMVSTAAPPAVGESMAPAGYILGPGDKVRITVFGEDRLSGEYIITSTGDLSFPLIGNVHAAGKSVADLQGDVRTKLGAGYIKDPRVTAEVPVFRPFYIYGEIARPGQYPYVDGLTIQQALATAGGFTYRAKTRTVYVRAAQATDEKPIDVKSNPNAPVRPGDTINIRERFF